MNRTNFLIGRGELLTHDIVGPKRKPGKAEVYTFAQARELRQAEGQRGIVAQRPQVTQMVGHALALQQHIEDGAFMQS